MEYVNLVNQIVEAEHSAKELGKEIQERQATLDSDLKQESAQLRESYFERAKRRISLVEETEQANAREDIARLDKKLADRMERVETSYHKNRDAWVDALFTRIVNGHA